MRKALLIVAACVLAACSGSDSSLINTTQQAVRAKLKDPNSAKFGDAYVVQPEEESTRYTNLRRVCGDVAAKNSYGAYDERTRFNGLFGKAAGSSEMELLLLDIESEPGSRVFEIGWGIDCKKPATS